MSTPLPPVPNVIKSIVEGTTSFAKNWFTLFYWAYTGAAPTPAALNALATDLYNSYNTRMMQYAPPTTLLQAVTMVDLATTMGSNGGIVFENPGTSTADKLPANCATLINYHVAMRYRGGHPRNYLYIGTDENLLNESEWNASYLAAVTTSLGSMIADMVGASSGGTTISQHVMVSYFGGVPTIGGKSQRRAVPLVLALTGASANAIVGSQRRRLGRRA